VGPVAVVVVVVARAVPPPPEALVQEVGVEARWRVVGASPLLPGEVCLVAAV